MEGNLKVDMLVTVYVKDLRFRCTFHVPIKLIIKDIVKWFSIEVHSHICHLFNNETVINLFMV